MKAGEQARLVVIIMTDTADQWIPGDTWIDSGRGIVLADPVDSHRPGARHPPRTDGHLEEDKFPNIPISILEDVLR